MTRHVNMVVGPTGGGKTVIIKTFCETQTSLNSLSKLSVLNPKAYDVTRFYGVLNPLNREWTDGIFSNIFRKFNQPLDFSLLNEKRFIIFDGDVDSVWIENMNSVMDDNRILTLPNQERIKLRNNCSLIFEVGHLKYASPATVSRVGIVYVDPNILGYEPFIKKWIKNRREFEQELLLSLYQKYIPKVLALIVDGILGLEQVDPLQMIIHQNALNLVNIYFLTLEFI